MASALDELRSALDRNPSDGALLQRFEAECVREGDFTALRKGLDPIIAGLGDDASVRTVAADIARALDGAAARTEDQREALELRLRAAELYAGAADDVLAAARALAAAWRIHADARVPGQVARLLGQPAVSDSPDYLLVALSLVGSDAAKVQALRRLAASHLDAGDLERAGGLYTELRELRADDGDAADGLAAIAALRERRARARDDAKREVDDRAEGAGATASLTRLGDAERAAGDAAAAEAAYRRAIAAGSAPEAEAMLEELLREQGRLDELAAFWAELLDGASRDRQVLLRRRLFRLLHDELDQPDDARRYLVFTTPAPAADQDDVLERARVLGAAGDWVSAAQLIEDALAGASSRDAKGAMLLELARILETEVGDAAGAERAYRRLRVTDPRDLSALSFYRRWYADRDEPRRAWANLAQLHAALDADEMAAERVDVAIEMARTAEQELSSFDKAIDAWRRVLADVPMHATALAELRRLYEEAGRWHALVDHLEGWVRGLPEDAVDERVELLFQIIAVYQDPERLPMDEMVVQTYERIVDLSPTNLTALDGLAGSFAQRERWSELAQVLARKVEVTEDPAELFELFEQIATLYLDQVRSESQAIPVLERMLELSPKNLDVMRKLREIYRRRHDSERLYAIYEREVALLEGSERLEVLVELATLASDPLFRTRDAIRWWRQVLALEPRHDRARAALEELHAEQSDWDGYVALLEQRLEGTRTRKQRVEVLLELGEVVYSRLGDLDRAQTIFAQIAEQSPFNTTARHFLQRLYVARRAWPELAALYAPREDWRGYVALLSDYAERADDRLLEADIHVEIARAAEEHLSDESVSLRHLELALKATPERAEIARRLVARYEVGVKTERRVPALESLALHSDEVVERLDAWRELAQVQTRAGDHRAAFTSWSRALVTEASLGQVDSLDDFDAATAEAGSWDDGYTALQDALGRLPSEAVQARLRLHRALGAVASARLSRHEEAVQHYRWVLQLAPGDTAALDALERIFFSQNDFEGLEDVFKARADVAETPAARVAPLFRLGQLYEDVLVDPPRAALVYQEILSITPADEEAVEAVVRVLELDEAFTDLAAILETALTRIDDEAARHRTHLRLARLYVDALDQPLAAIDHYQGILEATPDADDADVVEALEALHDDERAASAVAPLLEQVYRRRGDAAPLVRMLQTRAAAAEVGAEKIALLDELAMLAEGALDDPQLAFTATLERFDAAPGDIATWRELERLAGLVDGWPALAKTWRARVDAPQDDRLSASQLPALRMALAEIYHRRMFEMDDAVDQVERAVEESEDDGETLAGLETLEVLYKKVADLEGYVRAKLAASERVIGRDTRRRKILDACQALAGPLKREDEAIARCRALFDEDPGEADVGDALALMLERRRDFEGLEQLYAERIAATAEPEIAEGMRYRRAILWRDELDRWELAIDALIGLVGSPTIGLDARQALLEIARAQESESQRDVILDALADHYDDHGDAEGRLAVLLVRADFAAVGAERAALLRDAARTCLPALDRAKDERESAYNAFDLYTQALYEEPADEASLAAMLALAAQLDHWEALVDALEACAGRSQDAGANMEIWRHAARAAERELGDVPRAIAGWGRHVDAASEVDGADLGEGLEALDRLLLATGASDPRVDVLARRRGISKDAATRVALDIERARLLDELGRRDEAIEVLAEALRDARAPKVDPSGERRDALVTRLESLLAAEGRDAEVIDLLLGHVEDLDDPEAQRLLTYRAAAIATERLSEPDRAIGIYRDVLTTWPRDELALDELVRLYRESGDHAALAEMLEERLAMAIEAGAEDEVVARRLELGALYLDPLERGERAVQEYGAILAHAPEHPEALARLERLAAGVTSAAPARRVLIDAHRRSGAAADLARTLEASLRAHDPHLRRAEGHAELAALYRDALDAPEIAWSHAGAAYRVAPQGEAGLEHRRALLAIASDVARVDALAALLLEVSSALPDRDQRAERRLADLEELDKLGVDEARTLPHWQAVLADDPAHPVALDRVESWARTAGDDRLLVKVLRDRVAGADDDAARVPLRLELGRVLGKSPSLHDEAAAEFAAILAHDPLEREAFLGLVRLETRRKSWRSLDTLISERLSHVGEGEEAAGLKKRLARLRWQHLHEPASAVALYSEVLADDHTDGEAVAGLEALWGEGLERPTIFRVLEPRYEAAADWDKLIALYASTLESEQDDELQEECLLKMARLELVQLGRPDAAFGTLRALIERLDEPDEELDQLEALAERAGRWPEVIAIYESRVASGRANGALIARLASIQETRTGDVERAIHFYRFALEREPGERAVRGRLQALLERTERWDELVALSLVSADETDDDNDRVSLWLTAVRLLDERLDRPMEAVEVLEQIVDVRPADPDAHERIVALLERVGEREHLHDHLRRWIEQVPTDEQAVDIQVRLGRSLALDPATVREGLTELEGVLGTRPEHGEAIAALEAMLTRAEELAGRDELPPSLVTGTAEAATMLERVIDGDGQPARLARIVAAQLRALNPGEERQATLARLGRLLALADDPERAFACYSEALRADLGNVELEEALEALADDHAMWDELCVLYQRCSRKSAQGQAVVQRYLLKVANALHDRLDRRDEALGWFEKLLVEAPGHREALEVLAVAYQDGGDVGAEARVIAQWAQHAASDDELGWLLRRLALLRMDHLGDLAGAIEALELTLPESAADQDVVQRLERLYIKTAAFEKLASLYETALDAETAEDRTVELLAKLAQVAETRLDDPERARDACRRILALVPKSGFALTTLERVERALGDWEAVDEVLGWRIELASSNDMRVKLLMARAEVALLQRNQPAEALTATAEADELAGPGPGPDHLVAGLELLLRSDDVRLEAARRLQRRYKARKAWPRLINAIMLEHRATTDVDQRAALAVKAADVAEKKLDDPRMALRLLITALKVDIPSMKLRRLATELAERTGDWVSLVQAGEALLGEVAGDGELVRDLGMWLGPLQWRRREDLAGAVRTFEAVLGVDPHQREASQALAELYEATGDWRGQKDLLQGQLALAADDERERLLLQLAGIVAEHESPDAAVPILRDVLHARPDNEAAMKVLHGMLPERLAGAAAAELLEPVYRGGEMWTELVDLLQIRARATDAIDEEAALLRSAAVVYEEWLGDKITALKLYARAVTATPDDRAGVRQLERLGVAIGAWDQLVRVLAEVRPRMTDRAAQRDALLHLAQLHETRLDAPDKAIVNLLAALELEPKHRGAMAGLFRLYLRRGDLDAAVDVLRAIATVERAPAALRKLWDQVYLSAESAGETDLMMTACQAMLDLDAGDREAAQRLLPLYEREGLYPEMGGLYAMLAANTDDAAEEAALKLTLARLREQRLLDRHGAIEAYEEAWELDPSLTAAAERLETYYEEDGRWSNLASLLRTRIERAEDAGSQVALSMRLARLQADELGNLDDAILTYTEVIEEAPETAAAYDALIALFARQRRYSELARALTRKAEAQPDPVAARGTRTQAAAVFLDQLDEFDQARGLLEGVLAEAPDHAEAMLLMARLKVREDQPAEAVRLLEALVATLEGPRRFRILLELARVLGELLSEPERALPFALEARRLQPDHAALHTLLRSLLERTGSWDELQQLLEAEYAEASGDEARARRALGLARLHHDHSGDTAAFSEWLAKAEGHAPDSLEVVELAVDHHAAREEWDEVLPRLERLVDHLQARRQLERLPARAHELGRLHERRGDDERAAERYRQALEADGTYLPNLVDYGRLLVRRESWITAMKVHQSLLMQSSGLDEAEANDVIYHLALASLELGQRARAKQYLQRLERQDPDHEAAAALRERIG